MVQKTIPPKGGDEYDALSRNRKVHANLMRAGVTKKIKRRYNKRFRRIAKQAIENQITE